MCCLKDFITVFSLNTPIKVATEDENNVIYGRCYEGADRIATFDVYSIDELLNRYGDYIVDFSYIRNGILHIDIIRRS